MRRPAAERFWRFVEKKDDCWLFTGAASKKTGYGQFNVDGHCVQAHHFLIGRPPKGMTWDHTCHNADTACKGGLTCIHRRCVRPEHLQLRSIGDNSRASQNWSGNRLVCVNGHTRGPETIDGKWRRCRICHREAEQRRRDALR